MLNLRLPFHECNFSLYLTSYGYNKIIRTFQKYRQDIFSQIFIGIYTYIFGNFFIVNNWNKIHMLKSFFLSVENN